MTRHELYLEVMGERYDMGTLELEAVSRRRPPESVEAAARREHQQAVQRRRILLAALDRTRGATRDEGPIVVAGYVFPLADDDEAAP